MFVHNNCRPMCCLVGLFGLLALGLVRPNSAPAVDESPPHLATAVKFLKQLSPEKTAYRHKNSVVQWQGSNGATVNECFTDCSGFVNALFQHCYGFEGDAYKKWFTSKRPLARHYYEAIAAGKGFRRIGRIEDVRPGDVIAVKYEAGAENTGHVMLVIESPQLHQASAPVVPNTRQWQVTVIDQSMSGHGKTDTRRRADGSFRSGLGSGIVRIYTDAAGQVVGYSWSTLAKSTFRDQKSRQLVIGRLTKGQDANDRAPL